MGAIKQRIGHRNTVRLAWHHTKAFLAALFYRFPAKELKVIGITGTDGKTTTVGMVHHILKEQGLSVVAASTAFVILPSGTQVNRSHKTSMSPFVLQKLLRQGITEGATHAVIEASSHGLVQGRLNYIWPQVAAITNITPESLDYHGTFEQYKKDKGILFTMLRGNGTKVINVGNIDCEFYTQYPSTTTLTYGTSAANMFCTSSKSTAYSTNGTIEYNTNTVHLDLPIPGAYNIQNAQCAILCALTQQVTVQQAVAALSTFKGIPGRLQQVNAGQDYTVFVDFTVTSGAYEQTLRSLQAMKAPESKLLVMCSSCGNRMREKRPIIGRLCSELADIVVVTEDETYGEDPLSVIEEVWSGVDTSQCDALKIPDRKEAINTIISKASTSDIVLLCGMGPFDSFKTLNGDIPWNEALIAKEAILESLQHKRT